MLGQTFTSLCPLSVENTIFLQSIVSVIRLQQKKKKKKISTSNQPNGGRFQIQHQGAGLMVGGCCFGHFKQEKGCSFLARAQILGCE